MEYRKVPKPPKDKTLVKKYASDAEILKLYYPEHGSRPIDPIAAAVTDDDIRDLMDELLVEQGVLPHDAAGEG